MSVALRDGGADDRGGRAVLFSDKNNWVDEDTRPSGGSDGGGAVWTREVVRGQGLKGSNAYGAAVGCNRGPRRIRLLFCLNVLPRVRLWRDRETHVVTCGPVRPCRYDHPDGPRQLGLPVARQTQPAEGVGQAL